MQKNCKIWNFLKNQFLRFLIISKVTFYLQEWTIPKIKAKNISFEPYVVNFLAKLTVIDYSTVQRSRAVYALWVLGCTQAVSGSGSITERLYIATLSYSNKLSNLMALSRSSLCSTRLYLLWNHRLIKSKLKPSQKLTLVNETPGLHCIQAGHCGLKKVYLFFDSDYRNR